MVLEVIDCIFSICKLPASYKEAENAPYIFYAQTDKEISLVCAVQNAPANALIRDDGWRAFRVAGTLDFSLIGILSKLSAVLAEEKIGVFVISTFDTDYILTRDKDFSHALEALGKHGYEIKYL